MVVLQFGGLVNDVQFGVDFFQKLKLVGNYILIVFMQVIVVLGEILVVIQWSFNNVVWGFVVGLVGNLNWKVIVFLGVGFGSYYNQMINIDGFNLVVV